MAQAVVKENNDRRRVVHLGVHRGAHRYNIPHSNVVCIYFTHQTHNLFWFDSPHLLIKIPMFGISFFCKSILAMTRNSTASDMNSIHTKKRKYLVVSIFSNTGFKWWLVSKMLLWSLSDDMMFRIALLKNSIADVVCFVFCFYVMSKIDNPSLSGYLFFGFFFYQRRTCATVLAQYLSFTNKKQTDHTIELKPIANSIIGARALTASAAAHKYTWI